VVATLGTTTYTEATTKGTTIGAVRRDADTTLVDTTNEIGPLQMDANGRLKVEVFSGESLPVTLASTTVTGTVAVTQSGTWNVTQTTASNLNAVVFGYDGATQRALTTDSNGELQVDVLTMPTVTVNAHAVTNSGTFVTQENGAALTALQLIDDTVIADNAGFTDGTTRVEMAGYVFDETAGTALTENDAAAARIDSKRSQVMVIEDATTRGRYTTVTAANALSTNIAQLAGNTLDSGNGTSSTGTLRVAIASDNTANTNPWLVGGNIAHDAVDSGNPNKVGGRAIAHGANPTAVAAADRTDWYFNRAGIPFVIGGHPNIVTIEAEYTTVQTNTAIITVSTGTKIVVTQIQATCDNANTVDVGLRVGFGTASTPTTTGVVLTHPGIASGSGVSRGDGNGILGSGADNEDLRVTSEVPTSGALRILVSYYTIES